MLRVQGKGMQPFTPTPESRTVKAHRLEPAIEHSCLKAQLVIFQWNLRRSFKGTNSWALDTAIL